MTVVRTAPLLLLLACASGDPKPDDDTDPVEETDTDATDPPVDTALPDDTDAPPDSGAPDTADTWRAPPVDTADVATEWPLEAIPGPHVALGSLTPGTWWIDDPDRYEALLGEPAPPGLIDGTQSAIAWYPGDRPWLTAWASVERVRSWSPGTATIDVVRHDLDPACSAATNPLPVLALALVARPPVQVTQLGAMLRGEPALCDAGPIEGQPCRLDAPCQPGAVCGGASRGDGVCVDASLTGSFAVAAGTIPDGDPDGLVIEIPVSGLGTVAEDVLLALDLHHPEPSQLEITLTMPDGDSAVVHDHGALDGGTWSLRRPAALPADTSIHGTWTLRVVDATPGDAGTVDGGALELVSRWD